VLVYILYLNINICCDTYTSVHSLVLVYMLYLNTKGNMMINSYTT